MFIYNLLITSGFRYIPQSLLLTCLNFRPDVIEKSEGDKNQPVKNFLLTHIVIHRENYCVMFCPLNKGYKFILLSRGKAKAYVPNNMIKI